MRYTAGMRMLFAFALVLLAAPAGAQDRLSQGIGFAQAEEGTWLCRHENADEALACAREHCAEQAPGQECVATAWCRPARWSGLMTVWLGEFHTTRILCGAVSEAALSAALATLCAFEEKATGCDLTLIIDPEGNERRVEGVSFAGPTPPEVTPEEAVAPGETPEGVPEATASEATASEDAPTEGVVPEETLEQAAAPEAAPEETPEQTAPADGP